MKVIIILQLIGAIVNLPLLMIFLDQICSVSDIFKDIDATLKFCAFPQIQIYYLLKDKIRLSGIIVFEIFISIFFIVTNISLFIISLFVFLLKLLWHIFVLIFGKNNIEE